MGFWNDGLQSTQTQSQSHSHSGGHSHRHRSRSRSGSRSPSRRRRSSVGPYQRPTNARSASSFIESLTGYSVESKGASRPREPSRAGSYSSSRGIFGFGSSSNSRHNNSYGSRAQPRPGFVGRVRRWLRDLYYYLKKNPMKVFFMVILPLITGGALTKLLHTVGIQLPPGIERMMGGSLNRGMEGQRLYARGGARDFGGGTALPGMMGAGEGIAGAMGGGLGGGLGESAMGMLKIAKMFM